MKKLILTSFVLSVFCTIASSQPIPPDSLYLGQTPPGDIPQVFAPGIVSKPGRVEYGISISPDGKEMLFAIGNWPDKRTQIMEYKNSSWTGPDTVSFSMNRSAEEAIYSPDGQRVYYYAYSPPNPVGGADLCYSIKPDSVWSEPVNLGEPINTPEIESFFTMDAGGEYAYMSTAQDSYGESDIVRIKLSEKEKPNPVILVDGNVYNKKTG